MLESLTYHQTREDMEREFAALRPYGTPIPLKGGFEGTQFQLDSLSYYPDISRDEADKSVTLYKPEDLLRDIVEDKHPNIMRGKVDGDITVYKVGDLYIARLSVKRVVDHPLNQNLEVSPWTFGPDWHHQVTSIAAPETGALGHIYTKDSGQSDWSLHVKKPIPKLLTLSKK